MAHESFCSPLHPHISTQKLRPTVLNKVRIKIQISWLQSTIFFQEIPDPEKWICVKSIFVRCSHFNQMTKHKTWDWNMNFISTFVANMIRDLLSHFLSGWEREFHSIIWIKPHTLKWLLQTPEMYLISLKLIQNYQKSTWKCVSIILFPDDRQQQSKSRMYAKTFL